MSVGVSSYLEKYTTFLKTQKFLVQVSLPSPDVIYADSASAAAFEPPEPWVKVGVSQSKCSSVNGLSLTFNVNQQPHWDLILSLERAWDAQNRVLNASLEGWIPHTRNALWLVTLGNGYQRWADFSKISGPEELGALTSFPKLEHLAARKASEIDPTLEGLSKPAKESLTCIHRSPPKTELLAWLTEGSGRHVRRVASLESRRNFEPLVTYPEVYDENGAKVVVPKKFFKGAAGEPDDFDYFSRYLAKFE